MGLARSARSLALAYAGASVGFLIGAYFLIGDELRGTLSRLFQTAKAKIMEFA